MDSTTIDLALVVDMFLLLLIGVGPKIALVPYLKATAGMDAATQRVVVRTMLRTVTIVALILIVFGEILRRLLHFSTGALSIAGGIILFVIAVAMIRGPGKDDEHAEGLSHDDPRRLAVYPLAIPYLLNPAGIVVLVTASADAVSVGLFAVVVGTLAAVLVIDVVVFRFAARVGAHMDESRLLVTEKVFGFLLAALAVQLALNGLEDVGIVTLAGH
jgi:multiple antibiotic resistance protein